MSNQSFKKGDRVAWDTPPVVESDKTGKRAAHRSEALERRGS